MGYISIEPEGSFDMVSCPHCGYQENLEVSITGNWECESCKGEFWITPMRFFTGKPIKMVYDKDGRAVGYQLPISYLAFFPSQPDSAADDNTEHN